MKHEPPLKQIFCWHGVTSCWTTDDDIVVSSSPSSSVTACLCDVVVLGSRLVAAVRLGDIIVVVGTALVLVRLDVDSVVLVEVNTRGSEQGMDIYKGLGQINYDTTIL